MTFQEIALRMYPYWMMGLFTMFAVYHSKYKNLLRVEFKPIMKWIGILALLTVYRIAIFKIFSGNEHLHNMTSGASIIPIGASLTVGWEDLCHGLPLAIFGLFLGKDKIWKRLLLIAATILVMISFGMGHVYQGYLAAAFISFYIPFSVKKGQEIGFGSMMICHMMYDFITLLTIKMCLG